MYDKVVDSWYKHLGAVKSSGGDEIASLSDAAAAEVRLFTQFASVAPYLSLCIGGLFTVSKRVDDDRGCP
jgi:hypothetical protein